MQGEHGPNVQHMDLCSMLCGSLDGRGVGGEWIRACEPESLHQFTWNYCSIVNGFMCARSLQPFPTLCDPMDCSPPSSSVHGILQARILEWVAVPSSRESSWLRDQTYLSCGSCMAGRFFISEPPGKPLIGYTPIQNKKFKKIAGSKSLRSAFTLKDFLMEKLLLINFLTFNISVS